MKELEFPKYTREENLACKLTDIQIKEIRAKRKSGLTYPQIAKNYNITPQAVYYWCLDDGTRKKKNKKKTYKTRYDKDWYIEYRQRKIELHPELRDYELKSCYRFRALYPEKAKEIQKKSDKLYREKNKEIIKAKMKKYQLNNLEKWREYNKRQREKNREKRNNQTTK